MSTTVCPQWVIIYLERCSSRRWRCCGCRINGCLCRLLPTNHLDSVRKSGLGTPDLDLLRSSLSVNIMPDWMLIFKSKTALTPPGHVRSSRERKKQWLGSPGRFRSCLDGHGPARRETARFTPCAPRRPYPRGNPGPKSPSKFPARHARPGFPY